MSDVTDPNDAPILFGPFALLPDRRVVLEDDRALDLGSRALEILVTLASRPGELVTKEELIARVWPDVSVDESNLRVQVGALRKALRDGRDDARYIATIPGRGYRFIAPVGRGPSARPTISRVIEDRHPELPRRLRRVVGRDDAVKGVQAHLQLGRLLTVVGPGGIGKTTVALTAARSMAAGFADGVYFVDLAPLLNSDLVPGTLASVLRLAPVSGDATAAAIAFLKERTVLIVLDGCEHVVGAAAMLAEQLLLSTAGVSVLATSREPLRAEGETVMHLPPLELPPDSSGLSAAAAIRFPAVQLFVDCATAGLDRYHFGDGDAPLVAEICRRLDGIALAIELAAGRVPAFGIEGVANHLDDRFRLLTSGRRTALPRHQTLRAALDWSYEFLQEEESTILRRLGIFVGSFGLESAVAVAADAGTSASNVIDAVASLVTKSLVALDPGGAGGTYRLLDTTREYSIEKLTASGEKQRIARRHAEHYRALLQQIGMTNPGSQARDKSLHSSPIPLIDNVRAALDWAFSSDGDVSISVELTLAAIPFWFRLSLIDECFRRMEQALNGVQSITTGDARSRRTSEILGALYNALVIGFADDALAKFTGALALAERVGDREAQLAMLFGIWTCHFMNCANRRSLTLARRFCELAEVSSEPADRLIGDRLLGSSLHRLGEQAAARRHLERMLEAYVAPTERALTVRYQIDQRALARGMLSRVLWLQGFPDQASQSAKRAVEDTQKSGNPVFLSIALAHAGCPIALLIGDLDKVERSVRMMLDQATRDELGPWNPIGRCFEGALCVARGHFPEGLNLLSSGLAAATGSGMRADPLLIAAHATAFARSGEVNQGLSVIQDELSRCERDEERWCMAELLRVKGEILLLLSGPRATALAEECFEQSLKDAQRTAALSWELRSATSLARLARGARRKPARNRLASIYRRFSEGFATSDLVAAQRILLDLT